MQNLRKRIVFLGAIFILLLLITLVPFFAQRQNRGHDISVTKKTTTITFTSEDLSKLLQNTLKEHLPFQLVSAEIAANETVHLSAEINKEDLEVLLREYDLPIYHVLPLFPDQIPTELDFSLNFHEGHLVFSPLCLKIAEFDLTGLLSTKLVDGINRSINEKINQYHLEIVSLESLPGSFSIQFRR